MLRAKARRPSTDGEPGWARASLIRETGWILVGSQVCQEKAVQGEVYSDPKSHLNLWLTPIFFSLSNFLISLFDNL